MVAADQLVVIREGEGVVRQERFGKRVDLAGGRVSPGFGALLLTTRANGEKTETRRETKTLRA